MTQIGTTGFVAATWTLTQSSSKSVWGSRIVGTAARRQTNARGRARGGRERRAATLIAQQDSATPATVTGQPVSEAATRGTETGYVDFVHYDGSSFALEYFAPHLQRPLRILVDPWLAGDLVFGKFPPFFRARKELTKTRSLDSYGEFDAIVISQDLPDHCHQPTLKLLDAKNVPIIVPLKAVPIVEGLGYKRIIALAPGDRTPAFPADSPLGSFSVRAGAGSITGPPWSEPQLAFLFEFGAPQPDTPALRIYHETHGMHNEDFLAELAAEGRVDAAIAPVIGTCIPALGDYSVVNGAKELVQMCRDMKPRAVVPFNNTRTPATGFLVAVLREKGSLDELSWTLQRDPELSDVEIRDPKVLKAVTIAGVKDS